MKGRACSWRDIRKIKHILENAERLKGEFAALTNCADKSTLSTWKRQIEVMDAMGEFTYVNLSPSHAREIARHAPRDSWPEWVESCEKNTMLRDSRNLNFTEQSQ